MNRQRNHSTLVQNRLHPKPFSSRHTAHGNKYKVSGLNAASKVHVFDSKKSPSLKIGVCCLPLPILGALPDAKVIATGCRDPYGLAEVKCPESKFRVLVTPEEACSKVVSKKRDPAQNNVNLM